MLKALAESDALLLTEFFRNADYTRDGLKRTLIGNELTSARLRNLSQLLYLTRKPDAHNTLMRWFSIGAAIPETLARDVIPDEVLNLLIACGLLAPEGGGLRPYAMINPFEGMLLAADHSLTIETGVNPDVVLGLNATTWLLYRFAMQQPSRSTLDLGCGGGALALAAAQWSARVVATDLNPRAMEFLRFNASLNGLSHRIEGAMGDRFEPVAGRRFDRILANPPFFVTPSSEYLFCENRFELDEFCQRLVAEAPAHLEEGGYLQMIFEWVEIEGQNWVDRLHGWLAGSGCDAIVYKTYSEEPSRYALERSRNNAGRSQEQDATLFADWMRHYEERRVRTIHGGMLAMRRRSGTNWIRIAELPGIPAEHFGEEILAAFATRDLVDRYSDDQALFDARPALGRNVRLNQQFQPATRGWERIRLDLTRDQVLPTSQSLEGPVAEFIGRFDGQRSLREIVDTLVAEVGAPREQVERECLGALRLLIERGFMSM